MEGAALNSGEPFPIRPVATSRLLVAVARTITAISTPRPGASTIDAPDRHRRVMQVAPADRRIPAWMVRARCLGRRHGRAGRSGGVAQTTGRQTPEMSEKFTLQVPCNQTGLASH